MGGAPHTQPAGRRARFPLDPVTPGQMSAKASKYAGAIAIALVAVGLRWTLIPLLGTDTPFATVIAATAIAVWMGGWGPAVVAAAVGLVGTGLVIGRPLGTLPTDRVHTLIGLILYTATCA